MKKVLLLLLSVFFTSHIIYADINNKHIFYLDNPTNENIEITLDSKIYKLKSKTFEVLKLKIGEHIAELSDGRKVHFKIFANSKGGIINPTGAPYIFNNFIPYESSRICVDWQEPQNTTISIDGVTFNSLSHGLSIIDDFIIDKNYIGWEYDIFENVNEESMKNKLPPETDIHVFSKIYSRYEFIDKEELERYEAQREKFKMKANLPEIEDYNIPSSEDKTFQNYIKQVIELDKAYKDTNDVKKQKKILKKYDKIAKILWSKYNFGEGSYNKVNLKKLNLKSLDRGVIITKVEK
ncbi:hypothetical protein [Fusobacterium nucleatum]|uniref:hypothetical protein n=1 Tax=Fusobacterium nucleatum TaxID=851 RepID=UPI0003F5CCEA|nr:hypothetical protein [Fusobacterium nucleatum]